MQLSSSGSVCTPLERDLQASNAILQNHVAMSGMEADEEDFETASEAKETIEERHKKTRDNQMIIVNTANTITTATLV